MERFVLFEGQLVFDMRQKAPGRGAYLHPKCLEQALKKQAFSRAFKQKVNIPQDLRQQLIDGITRRLQESITTCVRAQAVSIGQSQTAEAMKANRVHAILLAHDAGSSTLEKYQTNADRKDIAVFTQYGAQEIGSLCGKTHVTLLGLMHATLAQQIANDLENLRQLGVFAS